MMPTSKRDFVTPREVARMAQVSHQSVHRWLQQGLIKATPTPGGYLRIAKREAAAFLRERGVLVPKELDGAVRVFVVDDNDMVRRALKAVLARAPFPIAVTDFALAEQALVAVGADRPDIVLLDALMPGVNGLEVCRAIKSNPTTKHVLVIGISAFADKVRDDFIEAGLDAFVEKPFDGKVIVPLVELLLLKARGQRVGVVG